MALFLDSAAGNDGRASSNWQVDLPIAIRATRYLRYITELLASPLGS
ncbi:MAG: hypothetical protein GY768_04195 [Planctomycetaceae bacterium]|nr:hypothetical protein [Planctomycetaceae bacterium]